ncbi:MAG: heme ABC exporter ATP-binding protein CcmA [Anaerolineae bacterium]
MTHEPSSTPPSDAGALLSVRRLSKRFGAFWALRDVDLDVRDGEVVTLFGPNGAGKTTLMRIVAGLSKPSAGEIDMGGVAVRANNTAARRILGFVSHQPLVYPDLTAQENLVFFSKLYDLPEAEARAASLLKRVGLAHRAHQPLRQFSRGMQQRVAIARALLHDPRLLLLDEPYTGLDPAAMDWLTGMLAELKRQGHTILMTSHDLDRGVAVANRVAILASGRLAYAADCASLAPGELAAAYAAASHAAGGGGA